MTGRKCVLSNLQFTGIVLTISWTQMIPNRSPIRMLKKHFLLSWLVLLLVDLLIVCRHNVCIFFVSAHNNSLQWKANKKKYY